MRIGGMIKMKPFKVKLLATAAAGLVLAFGDAASAQAKKTPATPDLATITSVYQTKDSKALGALEARMNKERPARAPRIVYVDPDIMATWLQLKGSMDAFPGMTKEYLQSKGVTSYNDQQILAVATLSAAGGTGSFAPLAAPGADLSQADCVVLPLSPNMPAESFMRRAFTLSNPRTGKTEDEAEGLMLQIPITRAQMEEIIDAREAWSCFGPSYAAAVAQTKDFDRVMALHRLAVFQDVGGLMQAVRDGADTKLISAFADFRATAAAATAQARAGVFAPEDVPFYGSVIDETAPALSELKARIDAMGVEKFRALSGEEMVKMAGEITDKASLTPAQATHIMGFAMLGQGYFRSLEVAHADPAAIQSARDIILEMMTREDAAVERSIRPMTAEEMRQSLVPAVTPRQLYDYLQQNIFADKDVQKDPGDPAARLRVHAEMIDHTRALMDQHPEAKGIIIQMLNGIFLSSPMMEKAPPPAPPQGPGRSNMA